MTDQTQSPPTVLNIAVAMFAVANQDAAIAYYTHTLGWEIRQDIALGEAGANRWVVVAPPGSSASLALNLPMGESQPGGSAIGVETPDVEAEYARIRRIAGVTASELLGGEGPAPRMFSITDPDGNHIWVVQSAT
jgi:predicted enzyme related to lactoylglutathione lyase